MNSPSPAADQDQALREIRRLATEHGLTAEQIGTALGTATTARTSVLPKVFAYLGALFLFAGIAAFIAVNWDSFSSLARVGVTLGAGIALFIAAVIVERDGRWPALVSPLFLAALALEPTGMLVAFEEYGSGGDWRYAVLLTSFAVTLQASFTIIGAARANGTAAERRGNVVLVFAAVLFGTAFWTTLLDLGDVDETIGALAIGTALILVGLGLNAAHYRWNASAWPLLGSILVYLALWELLEDKAVEALFAALTMLGVYLSVLTQSRALLVTSVAALLCYIGYFTTEHFANSLGWPLALMFVGVAFVAVGYATLRFNRRYFSRDPRARRDPQGESGEAPADR